MIVTNNGMAVMGVESMVSLVVTARQKMKERRPEQRQTAPIQEEKVSLSEALALVVGHPVAEAVGTEEEHQTTLCAT